MTDERGATATKIDEGMWKGRSSTLPLSDVVDVSREDLIAEFQRAPLARHDVELQLMVSSMRGNGQVPRYVLSRRAIGRWRVVAVSPERGGPATVVSPRIFEDLEEAERFVFNLRLQDLARLGLTGGGDA